jgi:hypothetical protein
MGRVRGGLAAVGAFVLVSLAALGAPLAGPPGGGGFKPPEDVILLWARRTGLVLMLVSVLVTLFVLVVRRHRLMESQSMWLLFLGLCVLPVPVAFVSSGVALILLGMSVFAFVVYKQIRARTDSLTEKRYQPGEYVFRQGVAGDRIYVVTGGEVEVVREDAAQGPTVLARLGVGEFFGEMALLTDAPRNASVRAATEVATLSIERHEFQSLYASIPAFHQSVEAAMARHRR